jgi:hypothetical protein
MHAELQIFWTVISLSILLGFLVMAILPGWLRSRRRTAVRWQIVLTAQPGSAPRARQARGHRSTGRWIGSAAAA